MRFFAISGPVHYSRSMFRLIRDLSEAVQSLASSARHLTDLLPQMIQAYAVTEPLEERLAELERGRQLWEARVEAELLRADSKFKAARSSEERTRTMAAHAEALSSSDDGEEGIPPEYRELLRLNGEASEEVAVQPVSASVAPTPKARALQAKFGRVNG